MNANQSGVGIDRRLFHGRTVVTKAALSNRLKVGLIGALR